MNFDQEIAGKRIIVFGASRGIGFHMAANLIAKGGEVVMCSGNKDRVNAAFMDIEKRFPNAPVSNLAVDFGSYDALETALAKLETGKPFNAVIISSAVLGPSGDFAATDFVQWVEPFQVNVFGAARAIQYLLQNNLIRSNGKIVVLSGGISGPDPYFISFSASKHALNGFAYSLAHQLAPKEIWLNSILPGSYHTRMNESRIERGPDSIGHDNFVLALSRVQEDDAPKYRKLHALVEWLCSSGADGVYGRLISAQYDDWQNHIERLKNPNDDLYRIIRKKD